MAITWKSVQAPDFTSAIRANNSTADHFNNAVANARKVGDVLQARQDRNQALTEENFMQQLQGTFSTPEAMREAQQSGKINELRSRYDYLNPETTGRTAVNNLIDAAQTQQLNQQTYDDSRAAVSSRDAVGAVETAMVNGNGLAELQRQRELGAIDSKTFADIAQRVNTDAVSDRTEGREDTRINISQRDQQLRQQRFAAEQQALERQQAEKRADNLRRTLGAQGNISELERMANDPENRFSAGFAEEALRLNTAEKSNEFDKLLTNEQFGKAGDVLKTLPADQQIALRDSLDESVEGSWNKKFNLAVVDNDKAEIERLGQSKFADPVQVREARQKAVLADLTTTTADDRQALDKRANEYLNASDKLAKQLGGITIEQINAEPNLQNTLSTSQLNTLNAFYDKHGEFAKPKSLAEQAQAVQDRLKAEGFNPAEMRAGADAVYEGAKALNAPSLAEQAVFTEQETVLKDQYRKNRLVQDFEGDNVRKLDDVFGEDDIKELYDGRTGKAKQAADEVIGWYLQGYVPADESQGRKANYPIDAETVKFILNSTDGGDNAAIDLITPGTTSATERFNQLLKKGIPDDKTLQDYNNFLEQRQLLKEQQRTRLDPARSVVTPDANAVNNIQRALNINNQNAQSARERSGFGNNDTQLSNPIPRSEQSVQQLQTLVREFEQKAVQAQAVGDPNAQAFAEQARSLQQQAQGTRQANRQTDVLRDRIDRLRYQQSQGQALSRQGGRTNAAEQQEERKRIDDEIKFLEQKLKEAMQRSTTGN